MANVAFAIEWRDEYGVWAREHVGAVDDTTLFDSRAAANQACDELAKTLECDSDDLRVVPTVPCDCNRSGIGGSHEDHCSRVVQ